jgi:hypothetical protein
MCASASIETARSVRERDLTRRLAGWIGFDGESRRESEEAVKGGRSW